jgi:hypothetical protein
MSIPLGSCKIMGDIGSQPSNISQNMEMITSRVFFKKRTWFL